MLALSRGYFSFSHCPASREGGGHKNLGGGTAKTVDHHWSKGHSVSYNVVLDDKTVGNWPGFGGCLGIGQQVVTNCVVHHLFCIFFHHLYYFHILFHPATLPFSQCASFTFFSQFSPAWHCGEWVSSCVVIDSLLDSTAPPDSVELSLAFSCILCLLTKKDRDWSATSIRHALFVAQALNRDKSSFPQPQVPGSSSVTKRNSDWGAHWESASQPSSVWLKVLLRNKTGPVALLSGSFWLKNMHEGKWLCVVKWSSWPQELGYALWKRGELFALAHWILMGTTQKGRRPHTICATGSSPLEKCTPEHWEPRGWIDNFWAA